MLEVAIPASDHRGEIGNNPRHAVASRAPCLFADLVLEPLQALFPHRALSCFEPVAKKFEPLPFKQAIPDVGFVRMKIQAIGLDPRLDFLQRRLRVFRALAGESFAISRQPLRGPCAASGP